MKRISVDFASPSKTSLSTRYNSGIAAISLYTGMTIEMSIASLDQRRGKGNCPKVGRVALRETGVGLSEQVQVFFHVEWSFEQRFRIPFAARRGEEIPTIDVDGARQSRQRVGHGVDDIAPERLDIPFPQRLRAGGLDAAAILSRHAAPEDVVLATRVNADHRPHQMIVRHDRHAGAPDHVEDGQLGRIMKVLHLGARGGAQPRYHRSRVGNRTRDDFTNRFVGCVEADCSSAIGDETVEVEHGVASHSAMRPPARRLSSDVLSDESNWLDKIRAPGRDRWPVHNGADFRRRRRSERTRSPHLGWGYGNRRSNSGRFPTRLRHHAASTKSDHSTTVA